MRSIGAPALEAVIDEGAATKIGNLECTGLQCRASCPVRGPDCETGRERAHLRFGRRTGRRVFEQARAMVPHHPRCEGRPERNQSGSDNSLSRVLPCECFATKFLVKDPLWMTSSNFIYFANFCLRNLGVWSAISEPGWTSRKKVPLGIRLKSTRPSHIRAGLLDFTPTGSQAKFSTSGALCFRLLRDALTLSLS